MRGGRYRLTRNPMYVGMALLTIGMGLWLHTWWVLIFLAGSIVAINRYVIPREEAYLHRHFGDEYDQYTRQVRRWLYQAGGREQVSNETCSLPSC